MSGLGDHQKELDAALERQLEELEQAKTHLQHANAETSARGHFRIVVFPPEGPAPLVMMLDADEVAGYLKATSAGETMENWNYEQEGYGGT